MKLRNIARKILQEQVDSVKLSDIKVDNSTAMWKVQLGSKSYGSRGYPFPNGDNVKFQIAQGKPDDYIPSGGSKSFLAWKILETAKGYAENKGRPIPGNFNQALNYFAKNNPKTFASITPDYELYDRILLRDKETVFLISKDSPGERTEWTDVPGLRDEPAQQVWNKSIYVGDPNLTWLNTTFKDSKATVVKKLTTPTMLDQIAVRCMCAADSKISGEAGFSGRHPKLVLAAINGGGAYKGIETISDYKAVDAILKKISKAVSVGDKYGQWDFWFIRNGGVYHKRWKPAEDELTGMIGDRDKAYDILRSINHMYVSFHETIDHQNAMRYAIVSDELSQNVAVTNFPEDGLYGLISQDGKASPERDKILMALLNKDLYKYNLEKNVAIDPVYNQTIPFSSDYVELQTFPSSPMPTSLLGPKDEEE